MNTKFKQILIVLTLLTISVILLRDLLFIPGMLVLSDSGFPLRYSTQNINDAYTSLFAWNTRNLLGQDSLYGPWLNFSFLLGLFGMFGFDGVTIQNIIYVISFFLSGFSAYFFCKFFKRSDSTSFLAALSYMLSPLIYEYLVKGYTPFIIVLAIMPIAFVFYIKALTERENFLRYSFIVALLWAFVSFIFQELFVFALLFISYAIFSILNKPDRENTFKHIKVIGIIFSSCFLLLSYWILPLIYRHESRALGASSSILLEWANVGLTQLNVIRLYAQVQPEWSTTVSSSSLLTILSFFYIFVAFIALLINKKNLNILFFSILALISIVLVQGVNSPPPINKVFYEVYNLSGIFGAALRGTNKFFPLLAISFLFLISEVIESISSRIKNIQIKRFYLGVLLLIISINSYQFLLLSDNITKLDLPTEYQATSEWISNQPGYQKVLLLPADDKVYYNNMSSYTRDVGIEAATPQSGVVFIDPWLATYNTESYDFSKFLVSSINEGRTRYLGKLLGISGVKYIVFSKDLESNSWKFFGGKSARKILPFVIENQVGLQEVKHYDNITIYLIDYFIPSIYIVDSPVLVTGNRDLLVSLSNIEEFNFSQNVLLFANQMPKDFYKNSQYKVQDIIVYDNSFPDLVFSQLPEYNIPLAKFAEGYYNSNTWTRLMDWYFFKKWEFSSSLNSPIIAGGYNAENAYPLEIPVKINENQSNDVWLKSFYGPESKSINIDIGGKKFDVNLQSKSQNEKWINLGKIDFVKGDYTLKLTSNNGVNVIENIIIAPNITVQNTFNYTYKFLRDKNITYVVEAEHISDEIGNWSTSRPNMNASQGISISNNNSGLLKYKFYVPRDEKFSLDIRLDSKNNNSLDIKIDNDTLILPLQAAINFTRYQIPDRYFSAGYHELTLFGSDADQVDIDQIIIKPTTSNIFGKKKIFSYESAYKNPTRYEIKLNATSPFWLVFSDSYDPLWSVDIKGESFNPLIGNSFSNLFYINKTGDLNMNLIFKKQKIRNVGFMVSGITFVGCVVYLLWDWRKIKLKNTASPHE